jgi:DNA polymerase III delta prime subunit
MKYLNMYSPIKNTHEDIKKKLDFFIKNDKVPNIIFHGQSGGGKRTIVNAFINDIYNGNSETIKNYVMNVNCAHGKGIKFIREELKFFAKTHINVEINGAARFKTIILSNADKLTIDAQSALRRCIEIFSNTRFFIIVEDKDKLLKPILSRLCDIYIPLVRINDVDINLYTYGIKKTFALNERTRALWLKKELSSFNKISLTQLSDLSVKLYEKGYSGNDLIKYIENAENIGGKTQDEIYKYQILITFNKIKKEIRNEKILLFFLLKFLFLRSEIDLENITIM